MSLIMKNPLRRALFVIPCAATLALCAPASAQRQSPALRPGEYVTEGAWGNLSLRPGNGSSLLFEIQATGGNMHVCSLDGEVNAGRATLEGPDEKTPCIVSFAQTPEGVKVTASASGACREYCGERAHFEGLYLRPSARCTQEAVASARKSFKQLYDTRQFAEARAKLEPVLTLCSRTLHRSEEGRIRNDLAVTMHKLGDLSGCLLVLQPWVDDAKLTDEGVRENYPPSDAEMLLPIVRAARTNLKLCQGQ
jgi:hypothetical protein